MHRALVQRVVLLQALLTPERPLVDGARLRASQSAAVGVERDGQHRRRTADAAVDAPPPDEVAPFHRPELDVLHASGDDPPVVRVVLHVEDAVRVALGVGEHAPRLPVVHGDRVVVVQTDAAEKPPRAVEGQGHHRSSVEPFQLREKLARRAGPDADARVAPRLAGGDELAVGMHRHAQHVIRVRGEKLLRVFFRVVAHADGGGGVDHEPVYVVRHVVAAVVCPVPVHEIELELVRGLLVRVRRRVVRGGGRERRAARLAIEEAPLGGALHAPLRGPRPADVPFVLLSLDVAVDTLLRERLERAFVEELAVVVVVQPGLRAARLGAILPRRALGERFGARTHRASVTAGPDRPALDGPVLLLLHEAEHRARADGRARPSVPRAPRSGEAGKFLGTLSSNGRKSRSVRQVSGRRRRHGLGLDPAPRAGRTRCRLDVRDVSTRVER